MTDDRRQQHTVHGLYNRLGGVYHHQPQSGEALASQPYLVPAHKDPGIPPYSVVASPSHYTGCVPPWRAPGLYTSTQEQFHAAPYANQNYSDYEGASATVQYGDQEVGGVPNPAGPAAYLQDDTTLADRNSYAASLAADPEPNGSAVVGYGPAPAETSAHSVAHTDGPSYVPTTESLGSSEFLRSLARRYILDPRTSVGTISMEPGARGLVEMTITLKVADTV